MTIRPLYTPRPARSAGQVEHPPGRDQHRFLGLRGKPLIQPAQLIPEQPARRSVRNYPRADLVADRYYAGVAVPPGGDQVIRPRAHRIANSISVPRPGLG